MDPGNPMFSHIIRGTIITHPPQVSDPLWGILQLLIVSI